MKMSYQRIKPLLAAFMFVFVFATPAMAQFAQFTTGRFTTTPITFNLGGGVTGTVSFSGAAGAVAASGLQAPTVSGANLVSNFVLIQPGAVARVDFNYPLSRLDLTWGPGNTTPRTDTFQFYTGQLLPITQNRASSLATDVASASGTGLTIVGFSLSSNSASPIQLGLRTSSIPAPAPLSPVGATLLGNLVAFGMIVLYRKRRAKPALMMAA